MWIITVRNWKSAQPSPAHPPPANSNKKLTHLGALFSFSFSLKYSITFFSQSGLTPFWAERKIYFSKLKVQSIIKDISLGCLIGSTVQDARSCRVAGGWILQLGWGRAPAGSRVLSPESSSTARDEAPDDEAQEPSPGKHSAPWEQFYTDLQHFYNYPEMKADHVRPLLFF